MTDLAHELHDFAVSLARQAVAAISSGKPSPEQSQTKVDAGDWVTPFDKEVELNTRQKLAAAYPDHMIVGEEFGSDEREAGRSASIAWHLDPIDGTMNFVHGVPWVAFSIAAVDSAGVLAGVVADAYRGDVYSAIRGRGAFLDGTPIRCANHNRIGGGLFLTEWSRQEAWPHMDRYLRRISAQTGATRIMGSCALALAMIGAGRGTGTVIPGHYNSWDVFAGALIAREGGAEIYDLEGRHPGVPLNGILAAGPQVAPQLWRLWTQDAL